MRDVLARVQDLGLVLKGGTAFAFAWGVNRHSTDLDFDTNRRVELRDRIESAARTLDVKLGPVERKDRPMRQRFLAPYPRRPGRKERFFKVNVRYKDPPRAEDIEVVDGFRTYKVPVLFDQKLAATASRIQPRDLFDLAFAMERYGSSLRDDQIRRADAFTRDLKRLKQRYKKAFKRDEILRGISDVEDTVFRFREATTGERDLRWPRVQEHRIPISTDFLGRVFVAQSRARLRARDGTEPRAAKLSFDRDILLSRRNADRKRDRAKDLVPDWSISR